MQDGNNGDDVLLSDDEIEYNPVLCKSMILAKKAKMLVGGHFLYGVYYRVYICIVFCFCTFIIL